MALSRSTMLCLVVVLIGVLALIVQSTPIQTLAAKRSNGADYVISMQRCKGSSQWTLHGLWPEWGQGCKAPAFDDRKNDPIRDELKQDWKSCPEFGKTDLEFHDHEYTKHGSCFVQRWNTTQIQYFQKGLDLLHELRPRCSPSLTGECRIKLDANLKPIN